MKYLLGLLLTIMVISCTTDFSSDGSRIGNKSTKVFHTTSCRFVSQIVDKVNFSSREEAINAGYSPDGSSSGCNP